MATILVPVDGSDHAFKALRIACDIADKYGASITLLHVLLETMSVEAILDLFITKKFGDKFATALHASVDPQTHQISNEMLVAIGKKILAEAKTRVAKRGLSVDALAFGEGPPAHCILKAISDVEANTLVMGSRGSDNGEGTSFGSVSQAVFSMAECTCISVK